MKKSPDEPREVLLDRFQREFGLETLPTGDLDLAFTHRSYAFENDTEQDNERLEFLGDALISAICSQLLFETNPDAQEGELSKRRSRLVSRDMLGRRANQMGIGPLLLLGRGERQTGGGRRRSVVGSALEALVGMVCLKQGYEETTRFVRRHIIEPLIEQTGQDKLHGDYKSALQEWAQQHYDCVPVYRRLAESGPDHAKAFTVEVAVGGRPLGAGQGTRIKQAENAAAHNALAKIKEDETSEPSNAGKREATR